MFDNVRRCSSNLLHVKKTIRYKTDHTKCHRVQRKKFSDIIFEAKFQHESEG